MSGTSSGPREATSDWPRYSKVMETRGDGRGTAMFMIVCDEGWRQSIVCERMYEWAADWLLKILGRIPYGGAG